MVFLALVIVKYMKKKIDIMKPPYSEYILSSPLHFFILTEVPLIFTAKRKFNSMVTKTCKLLKTLFNCKNLLSGPSDKKKKKKEERKYSLTGDVRLSY